MTPSQLTQSQSGSLISYNWTEEKRTKTSACEVTSVWFREITEHAGKRTLLHSLGLRREFLGSDESVWKQRKSGLFCLSTRWHTYSKVTVCLSRCFVSPVRIVVYLCCCQSTQALSFMIHISMLFPAIHVGHVADHNDKTQHAAREWALQGCSVVWCRFMLGSRSSPHM